VNRGDGTPPFRDEVGDEFEHPSLVVDIETRCRFVEHEHLGVLCERAGEEDTLALAAGEVVDSPVA
jgi:hypothetical protein